MNTIELITKAYTEVANGMKRVDLESDTGVTVKAYKAGVIIRIDIKGDKNENKNECIECDCLNPCVLIGEDGCSSECEDYVPPIRRK